MKKKNPFFSLIESFKILPGVGEKTAMRYAVHLMKEKPEKVMKLAKDIIDLKEKLKLCEECGFLKSDDICPLCSDEKREEVLCVVEDIPSVIAIEKAGIYKGHYHILHGVISIEKDEEVMNRIKALMERIKSKRFKEVIIATNPTVEGDATAFYIKEKIREISDVKLLKITSGIPVGGSIDMMDELTISQSFKHRLEF
jgi:recombination protein RecR